MNRKEFASLLKEWRDNFVLSERVIGQPQNLEKVGLSGEKEIVKKSRQLDAWLTYITVWDPNSPQNLNKYSEDSDTYDQMWDEGKQQELDYREIDIDDEESRFTMEFAPYAKKLGFNVSTKNPARGVDYSVVRLSPKKGKGKELSDLLRQFAGDEADKIFGSRCCDDTLPLFIVPFDFDKRYDIPGVKKYSAKAHTNINNVVEKHIMHWMIHDMWHLIPEAFYGENFSTTVGITDPAFKQFEKDPYNRDLGDAVSFTASAGMTDQQKAILNIEKDANVDDLTNEIASFLNRRGYTGNVEVGYDDVGPSIFSYVLMEVESHQDIDDDMFELSEESRNLVKSIFDLTPDFWNKICSFFENEIIIFVK